MKEKMKVLLVEKVPSWILEDFGMRVASESAWLTVYELEETMGGCSCGGFSDGTCGCVPEWRSRWVMGTAWWMEKGEIKAGDDEFTGVCAMLNLRSNDARWYSDKAYREGQAVTAPEAMERLRKEWGEFQAGEKAKLDGYAAENRAKAREAYARLLELEGKAAEQG